MQKQTRYSIFTTSTYRQILIDTNSINPFYLKSGYVINKREMLAHKQVYSDDSATG